MSTLICTMVGQLKILINVHRRVSLTMGQTRGPTASVMHLVGGDHPALTFKGSTIVRVDLSEPGFEALCRTIDASFARTESGGKATRFGKGLYGPSFFYEAHGTFSIFNVCNKWTAKALRAAGTPISTWHIITASSVLEQAEEFGMLVQQRD